MSQTQLFALLLVTLANGVTGARSLSRGEYAIGVLMLGIPVIGWLVILLGH